VLTTRLTTWAWAEPVHGACGCVGRWVVVGATRARFARVLRNAKAGQEAHVRCIFQQV
jgi:hypothetical protein